MKSSWCLLPLVSLALGCGHNVVIGSGGASSSTTGTGTTGTTVTAATVTGATTTANVTTGGGCTNDQQCGGAAGSWCSRKVTQCPNGMPPPVTVAATGVCKTLPAACAAPDDCPPGYSCSMGQCKAFPDQCTIAPQQCPAGCVWTHPWPCACVCDACP